MVRGWGAMALAAALTVSQTAFAADAPPPDPAPQQAPLAPGQAAGIRAAQTEKRLNTIAIVAGVGLAAVGVFLIVGTNYHLPGQHHATSGTK